MHEICVRLREERKRLKISQRDFGALGGVSLDSQFNYESGDRHPDTRYLAAIAAAGADVCYILTGNRGGAVTVPPPAPKLSIIEEKIFDYFRRADDATKFEIALVIGEMVGKAENKAKSEEHPSWDDPGMLAKKIG